MNVNQILTTVCLNHIKLADSLSFENGVILFTKLLCKFELLFEVLFQMLLTLEMQSLLNRQSDEIIVINYDYHFTLGWHIFQISVC